MKKLAIVMVAMFCISGPGFSTNVFGKVITPMPVSDSEIAQLSVSESMSLSVGHISAGEETSSTTTAFAAVGIICIVGLLLAVAAANNEDD